MSDLVKHSGLCGVVVFILSFSGSLIAPSTVAQSIQYTGGVIAGAQISDASSSHAGGVESIEPWFDQGVGALRYEADSQTAELFSSFIETTVDLFDAQWHLTGFVYPDGDRRAGITEAFLSYRPVTRKYRHSFRVGAFYPQLSAANSAAGWMNPHTDQFSAINSWIAEELKIYGAEWTWHRPASRFRSRHDLKWVNAIYTNNDVAGALLSWRGWAIHDRQTLIGEQVNFAPLPSFQGELSQQPFWVKPHQETDHRLGLYSGVHWRYKKGSDVRLYYYDNGGEETQLESSGQYAWDTHFYSLALAQKFDQYRILAQWLGGNTKMGRDVVNVDFSSWYFLASRSINRHQLSVRYDHFKVIDRDGFVGDPNDSNGDSWMLSWRYPLLPSVKLGAEYVKVQTHNDNRALFGIDPSVRQDQFRVLAHWHL